MFLPPGTPFLFYSFPSRKHLYIILVHVGHHGREERVAQEATWIIVIHVVVVVVVGMWDKGHGGRAFPPFTVQTLGI